MTTGRENGRSRLISVRLPHKMLADLKRVADKLGRPYQAVLKDAVEHGLPIVQSLGATESKIKRQSKTYSTPNVEAAIARLRQNRK
jgi:predicted DNA-binding protein